MRLIDLVVERVSGKSSELCLTRSATNDLQPASPSRTYFTPQLPAATYWTGGMPSSCFSISFTFAIATFPLFKPRACGSQSSTLRFHQTEKRKSSEELSSHALKNAHPRKRARRKALPKAPPFSRSKNAHRAIAILWDPQARRDPQAAALVPRSHRHCCLLVFFCFLPPIRLSAAPVVLTPALCLLLVAVWRQLPLTLQPRAAF